jgi:hypothetical protein
MLKIKKRYVVNEHNETVAIQLDLQTFEKIECLLEDYALGQSIKAADKELSLGLKAARKRYAHLKKASGE